MRWSQPRFEELDGLRVPLGGVNGYKGVRGKQGRKKNKFQGVTPRKQHRTGPEEHPEGGRGGPRAPAARCRAGYRGGAQPPDTTQPPANTAARKKVEVGTYLGHLLRLPQAGIPTVACALLSQQEAAEAVARGVAVAYARLLA